MVESSSLKKLVEYIGIPMHGSKSLFPSRLSRFLDFLAQNPNSILLALCYAYIFFYPLSYESAWVCPEELHIKSYVLKDGASLRMNDIKKGLNYDEFEWEPRASRPLSSYFEILNTKLRCWLWKYIVPHPSFSITWLFLLVLSPLLLFKLLRNLKVSSNIALGGICLYLLSPATLSLVAYLFRPGKSMVNFSMLLCLYVASEIDRVELQGILRTGLFTSKVFTFPFLILIMFVSFFWDETALLTFPAVALLFPRILKSALRFSIYACLPMLVYFFYTIAIPKLTEMAGWPWANIANYQSVGGSQTELKAFLNNSLTNIKTIFTESFGIIQSRDGFLAFWDFVLGLNILLLSAFFIYSIRIIVMAAKTTHSDTSLSLLGRILCLTLGFIAFHCVLMSHTIANKVWPLYWYGTYLVIPLVLLCTLLLKMLNLKKQILFISILPLLLISGHTFIYTNSAYKRFHHYPYHPDDIRRMAAGELNRFCLPDTMPHDLFATTYEVWKVARMNQTFESAHKAIPKELQYLLVELWPGRYNFPLITMVRDGSLKYYQDTSKEIVNKK